MMLSFLNILQDVQGKAQDSSVKEYIASHSDKMNTHIWAMTMPKFTLPEPLAFLSNAVDAAGNPAFQVTAQMFAILVVVFILVLIAIFMRDRKTGKLNRLGHAVEALLIYTRDEIAIPNLGEKFGRYLTPFLMTVFVYILLMNYLSLIPGAATATANLAVTATLAGVALFMIEFWSFRKLGFAHYFGHLTMGTHWSLWFLIVPIEIVGKFAKPFALAIRLFANMTAGHIIIYALLGLMASLGTYIVAIVAVPMSVFVYALECLVALLQAFIFTLLTALFIGLSTADAHDHEDEHHVEAA